MQRKLREEEAGRGLEVCERFSLGEVLKIILNESREMFLVHSREECNGEDRDYGAPPGLYSTAKADRLGRRSLHGSREEKADPSLAKDAGSG